MVVLLLLLVTMHDVAVKAALLIETSATRPYKPDHAKVHFVVLKKKRQRDWCYKTFGERLFNSFGFFFAA